MPLLKPTLSNSKPLLLLPLLLLLLPLLQMALHRPAFCQRLSERDGTNTIPHHRDNHHRQEVT
jgi:hypothetical protein